MCDRKWARQRLSRTKINQQRLNKSKGGKYQAATIISRFLDYRTLKFTILTICHNREKPSFVNVLTMPLK